MAMSSPLSHVINGEHQVSPAELVIVVAEECEAEPTLLQQTYDRYYTSGTGSEMNTTMVYSYSS